MSRRHFAALALALRLTNASMDTIRAVADVCAIENPRFSRSKFYEACGVAASTEAT